ncbi:hypothetical protein ANMWB30_23560 [Arthrobacter sp. MWB30]|nr:hypothetical protein ANMWB30_23560 [Arthrobacter sp. MWB30]
MKLGSLLTDGQRSKRDSNKNDEHSEKRQQNGAENDQSHDDQVHVREAWVGRGYE